MRAVFKKLPGATQIVGVTRHLDGVGQHMMCLHLKPDGFPERFPEDCYLPCKNGIYVAQKKRGVEYHVLYTEMREKVL